jgi:RNA polymerase sigma-70 factor (ECF subfamily)
LVADDRLWLRQMRRGDIAALGAIYEAYKSDLLTVALSLLGEPASAEDCLHDVFVTLASKAAELRVRGKLKCYLAACVANRARDVLRRERKASNMPEAESMEMTSEQSKPLDLLADHEEATRIQACIARLPYEQREAITLRLHGRLTFRQISRLQSVSVYTVQSRYRYGLEKVRKLLRDGRSNEAAR